MENNHGMQEVEVKQVKEEQAPSIDEVTNPQSAHGRTAVILLSLEIEQNNSIE